ncbi:MAG TPA: hypothetical protein VFD58_36220 [Blastocatellia bacterium]|nr:hypothetical protein [Blastocatellia bacterium]
MKDRDKARIEQNANHIVSLLADKREEFEQQGISEDAFIGAAGPGSADESKAAIDHLENKEIVVRVPEALTRPPLIMLKPGRMWEDARDKVVGAKSAVS